MSLLPPKSLLSLSNELLELVIANIELPQHLLNLAVTCHHLSILIIPNHLQFRHIRTNVTENNLWLYLTEKPLLAANVRILDLNCNLNPSRRYRRRCPRIPMGFIKPG